MSLLILVAAALLWWRVSASPPVSQKSPPPIPVVVAAAEKGDIGVYVTGLGTVTPLNTITVKTRVDGELMTVAYHEGEIVRKGAPLVEIDPRPFQVQLEQAEAQLAKDQAALQNARVDLQRYEDADHEERGRAAGAADAARDGRAGRGRRSRPIRPTSTAPS